MIKDDYDQNKIRDRTLQCNTGNGTDIHIYIYRSNIYPFQYIVLKWIDVGFNENSSTLCK